MSPAPDHNETDAPAARKPRRSPRASGAIAAAALALLFIATAWPVVLAGIQRGRMAGDQINYHELVVREFIGQLPAPDYSDYRSATTPGYHTIVAALARIAGDARPTLQLLGGLFTLGLLVTLGSAAGARAPPIRAVATCAPVLTSLYIWPAGVWLLPDNAGWWGVLAMLLIALRLGADRPAHPMRWLIGGGVVLALLVYVRQIHLWPAALLWTGAWLGAAAPTDATTRARTPIDEWRALTTSPPARLKRTAIAIACTLPAFAIVGAFIALWGGLTPPMFQTEAHGEVGYHGGNPAAPAFILSIFAIISAFYAGYLAPTLIEMARTHKRWALAAGGIGALLALVPATTFSIEEGRWSGLWHVVRVVPDLGARTSPVILILSTAGSVCALAWSLALRRGERWVMLAALVAFSAAMSTSHELWHRYVEPLVLILVALAAVRTQTGPHAPGPENATRLLPTPLKRLADASRIIGPLALAAAFAALTAYKISTAPVPEVTHSAPPDQGIEQRSP